MFAIQSVLQLGIALLQLFSIPYYSFYFDFILISLSWVLRAKLLNSVKGFLSPLHLARGEADDPLDEIFQLIVKALPFRTASAAPISNTTGQRAAVDWAGLNQDPHQRLLFLFCVYSFVHIGA